eukprot:3471057-Pyramimonas_sp.AAC.1
MHTWLRCAWTLYDDPQGNDAHNGLAERILDSSTRILEAPLVDTMWLNPGIRPQPGHTRKIQKNGSRPDATLAVGQPVVSLCKRNIAEGA